MRIAVFEDYASRNFYPLALTRAIFDLRVGRYTLAERVEKIFGKVDLALMREHLKEVYQVERGISTDIEEYEGEVLLVNPRFALDKSAMDKLEALAKEKRHFILLRGRDVVGALLPSSLTAEVSARGTLDAGALLNLARSVADVLQGNWIPLEHPWELVERNAEALAADIARGEVLGEIDETVKILGNGTAVVEKGAVVEPYVVLDAREGPILIEEGARVKPFSYIEGPCLIGRGTVVMPGARVRRSSIGPVCRVGGEVEESIIHGYSNKYHEGFLGHAYVGEWVNLGALTTNSDLKNTYGTVKVRVGDRTIDSGRVKVGAFIGDHAKTSIGTLVYTGKRIGVSSHLHGVVAEDVPSFTIYARSLGHEPVELELESALETARRMMRRRGFELSESRKRLLVRIFEETKPERREAGVRLRRFKLPVAWPTTEIG